MMQSTLMNIMMAVFFISLLLLFGFLGYEDAKEEQQTTYIMSNGIECQYRAYSFGNINFAKCSDNKTYVNPEYYETKVTE